MRTAKAKSVFRKIAIVLGIVSGAVGIVGGITYAVENDRLKDEQFFCAPQKMDHVFMTDHTWYAVCIKNGTMYVSENSKK